MFNLLKSLTISQQLSSFLLLSKIVCHYKSLAPFKSMPTKKSNHHFKGKCPYIHAGTIKPMRIKDILTKNRLFSVCQYFRKLKYLLLSLSLSLSLSFSISLSLTFLSIFTPFLFPLKIDFSNQQDKKIFYPSSLGKIHDLLVLVTNSAI